MSKLPAGCLCFSILLLLSGCATGPSLLHNQPFAQTGHFSLRYHQELIIGTMTWQHCPPLDLIAVRIPFDSHTYLLTVSDQHVVLRIGQRMPQRFSRSWVLQHYQLPANILSSWPYWAQGYKSEHRDHLIHQDFYESNTHIQFHAQQDTVRYLIDHQPFHFLFSGTRKEPSCPHA